MTAAACGESIVYPYEPIGATVTCPTSMVGYAAVADSDADGGVAQATNGGNDSTEPPVTVNNVADFVAEVQGPAARVIFLDGMLAPTETIKVTLDKDVPGGNKTIIGVGASSGLTGAGLDLSYASNVIIRNLKISKVSIGEGDAITLLRVAPRLDRSLRSLQRSERHDLRVRRPRRYHARLQTSSPSRGRSFTITRTPASSVTPTTSRRWPRTPALSVTYHHNLFLNVNSGPRIRFGTAHLFSNHFQNVDRSSVSPRRATRRCSSSATCSTASASPITTMFQDPDRRHA